MPVCECTRGFRVKPRPCKTFARRWDPYQTVADGFDALFPKGTPMDLPGATDLYLMAMDAIYALPVRTRHNVGKAIIGRVCWFYYSKPHDTCQELHMVQWYLVTTGARATHWCGLPFVGMSQSSHKHASF